MELRLSYHRSTNTVLLNYGLIYAGMSIQINSNSLDCFVAQLRCSENA